jgi:hypothetical protein
MAIAAEPRMSDSLPWLDPGSPDDRLLASVIEVMRLNPRASVIVVTRDINFQNKLEFARVPFVSPEDLGLEERAWNDPAFPVSPEANPFRHAGWMLTTTAHEESAAKPLPQTGFLVRGLAGTKVSIDSREETISVRDAVRAAAGGYLSGDEDFAKRVLKAQTMLRYAVGHSKPLLRAVRLCAYA